MDRHTLIREVAYGLYRHRGPGAGNAYTDWVTAEQLFELVFSSLEQSPQPVASEPQPPAADPADAALKLLQDFVAQGSRRAAAKRLGYASTSTVGKILRGQRALSPDLIERIQRSFGEGELRKAA